MASATPHDGKAPSFASLMNMLNPTAIADPDNYGPDEIRGLFLRRHKKDVQAQMAESFLDRIVTKHPVEPSALEERAYDRLADAEFVSFDKNRRTGQLLFKTVVEKSLFSSPAAAAATVRQRLRKLEKETNEDASRDRRTLQDLGEAFEAVGPQQFTKYQRLVDLLKPGGDWNWNPKDPADRIVLFTERVETLRFLEQHLPGDLGLKADQVQAVHGSGVSDKDLQEIVEDFGREKSPIRLLIATDIASEGLNLHYLCHKLLHFDIPWSLMVFQQRNGRIDRYGQTRRPQIGYLYSEPSHEKIRGDLRILELLIEKDEQAAKNIGDPSIFLGVHDAAEEEAVVGKAIEDRLAPDQFESQMDASAEDDLLSLLLGDDPQPSGATAAERTHSFPSLYRDDFAYFTAGLASLDDGLQSAPDPDRQLVTLTVNDDLRRVFRSLPEDALPDDGRIYLTTDRKRVKKAIQDCRSEERKWPDVHLLWDLHPIMEWLNFKLMVKFGRQQAPVVRLQGTLDPQESLFLMQGEIPNRKGQPVIHEWFAVRFDGARSMGVLLSLDEFLERTRFNERPYPNQGASEVPLQVKSLLPDAVEEARRRMSSRRKEFQLNIEPELENQLAELAKLRGKQLSLLEVKHPENSMVNQLLRDRKRQRRTRIEDVFSAYQSWIEETLSTEDSTYLTVAAVFLG